jgi:hypothetical protein
MREDFDSFSLIKSKIKSKIIIFKIYFLFFIFYFFASFERNTREVIACPFGPGPRVP